MSTYGEVLRRAQHEVSAYGRKAEEGLLTSEEVAGFETAARVAFARAQALAEVGIPAETAAAELSALVSALQPLLSGSVGFAARSA